MRNLKETIIPRFEDFTEENYRRILIATRKKFKFEAFGTELSSPHVLWRHDVDLSVHRAYRIAQIEAEEHVTATYFLHLHSDLYNVLERPICHLIRKISDLGHGIGLHFDGAFFDTIKDPRHLDKIIKFEKSILENIAETEVTAVSFHEPTIMPKWAFAEEKLGGLVSAYSQKISDQYSYVSDSNGYWRHRRLIDVIESGQESHLHILTHPGWWTPEVCSPRVRVSRCIDGRAQARHKAYDLSMKKWGRENIQ